MIKRGMEQMGRLMALPVRQARLVGEEAVRLFLKPQDHTSQLVGTAQRQQTELEQMFGVFSENVADADTRRVVEKYLATRAVELLRLPEEQRPEGADIRLRRIGETLLSAPDFSVTKMGLDTPDAVVLSLHLASIAGEQ